MTRAIIDVHKAISEFLGRGGLLAKELAGYEYREEQIRMAEAVLNNLQNGGILMVEAGTGTGKTLAYLIPALLYGQRVIISTGTKTLQEQIFYKDLPVLGKHFNFRAVMMKGRGNYLCWRRFHKFCAQPKMEFIADANLVEQIRSWSRRTETGDREELVELPEGHPVWEKICSDSELCPASLCAHFKDCFITDLKSRAQKSDIIVVNHHLFFADLALRKDDFGEVIPRYDAVIFDEAHLLEDIITDYFGVSLSDRMLKELCRDLMADLSGLKKPEHKTISGCVARIENFSESLFSGLRKHFENLASGDDKRIVFKIDDAPAQALKYGNELVRELGYVSSVLSDKKDSPDLLGLSVRAAKLAGNMDFLLRQNETGYVYYSELKQKSTILRASPIQVATLLREIFYPHLETIIFTSATLTTFRQKEPSFDYFKSRMGLDEAAKASELLLKSSFNWEKQALLFLPKNLPHPDNLSFVSESCHLLEQLLNISKGRAFLLFTSYKNLEAFYEILYPRLKYPCLCQGDKPRSELLREFRQIEESILFATTSFWQGVDVVGPSLSLVVIDRLPFDSPGDPLIQARINHINSQGGNSFLDYQVPSAVIMLRQGLGRLIRSSNDRGVLCVLDPRLQKKSYGRIFLNSLPKIPITHNFNQVAEFFARENL